MTSLNFSQRFAALDHLESVRIYITHGLAGRENQMPRPPIMAGAGVFPMDHMDGLGLQHRTIYAIVSPDILTRQFLPFPHPPLNHSHSKNFAIPHPLPVPQPKTA